MVKIESGRMLGVVLILAAMQCSLALLTHNVGNGILYKMNATDDVFVYDGSNQNYYDFLIVGKHLGYPLKRTLVKFEDIPPNCKSIQWAKMYLYIWNSHSVGFRSVNDVPYITRPLEVRQVKKSWQEKQATRDSRLSGVPWSTPYLNIAGLDARKRPLDTVTVFTGRPSGYIEFDITKAARKWLSGHSNNGVVISATNEDVVGHDSRFYSHEHSNSHPIMSVLCDY